MREHPARRPWHRYGRSTERLPHERTSSAEEKKVMSYEREQGDVQIREKLEDRTHGWRTRGS